MRAVRAAYLVVGLALVGVGIVGVLTPGLPGTIFLILSLFCFKRSSPRMENWLLTHPKLGPTLRDWEKNRSIKPRTKVIAIVTMWVCIGLSANYMRHWWVFGVLVLLGVIGSWYILTRRPAIELQPEGQGSSIG